MSIKLTLFFEHPLGDGWSESYVKAGNSVAAEVIDEGVDTLVTARKALLGTQSKITYARASLVENPRVSRVRQLRNQRGPNGHDSDLSDVALLVKLTNAAGDKYVYRPIRGIWDDVCLGGGTYNPGASDYDARVTAFGVALRDGGWGWLGVNTKVTKDLLTVTSNPANILTLGFAADSWLAGDVGKKKTVRITGVVGATQLNGTHIVEVMARDSLRRLKPLAIFPYSAPSGKVTMYTRDIVVTSKAEPWRISERKTGRTSFVSRGRASRRR